MIEVFVSSVQKTTDKQNEFQHLIFKVITLWRYVNCLVQPIRIKFDHVLKL